MYDINKLKELGAMFNVEVDLYGEDQDKLQMVGTNGDINKFFEEAKRQGLLGKDPFDESYNYDPEDTSWMDDLIDTLRVYPSNDEIENDVFLKELRDLYYKHYPNAQGDDKEEILMERMDYDTLYKKIKYQDNLPVKEGLMGTLLFNTSFANKLYDEFYRPLTDLIKKGDKEGAMKEWEDLNKDFQEEPRMKKKWAKTFVEVQKDRLENYKAQIDAMEDAKVEETINEEVDITKDPSFVYRSPKQQKIMLMKQGLSSDGYNGYVFAGSPNGLRLVRLKDNKIIHSNPGTLSDEELLNLCENLVKDPYYDSLATNEPKETDDENVQKLIDDAQAIFVKLKPQIVEICTEYSNSRNKDTFDPAIWGELPDEYSDDSDMLWKYYSDLKKLLADNGVHPALISAFDDYFEPAEYFKYKYLLASFKLIDVNDVKYNLNEELEKLHTKRLLKLIGSDKLNESEEAPESSLPEAKWTFEIEGDVYEGFAIEEECRESVKETAWERFVNSDEFDRNDWNFEKYPEAADLVDNEDFDYCIPDEFNPDHYYEIYVYQDFESLNQDELAKYLADIFEETYKYEYQYYKRFAGDIEYWIDNNYNFPRYQKPDIEKACFNIAWTMCEILEERCDKSHDDLDDYEESITENKKRYKPHTRRLLKSIGSDKLNEATSKSPNHWTNHPKWKTLTTVYGYKPEDLIKVYWTEIPADSKEMMDALDSTISSFVNGTTSIGQLKHLREIAADAIDQEYADRYDSDWDYEKYPDGSGSYSHVPNAYNYDPALEAKNWDFSDMPNPEDYFFELYNVYYFKDNNGLSHSDIQNLLYSTSEKLKLKSHKIDKFKGAGYFIILSKDNDLIFDDEDPLYASSYDNLIAAFDDAVANSEIDTDLEDFWDDDYEESYTPIPEDLDDEPIKESYFEDEPSWLDDDDPVEADREHANLYGGDRTYCDTCGSRLAMDEWGSYCPKCNSYELEEALNEELDKLATNSKGDYLVCASSGHGWTVYNKSHVAIGGIDTDDAEDDEEAIRLFKANRLSEAFDTRSDIDLDMVGVRVANLLDEENLGDNWIEFDYKDSRGLIGSNDQHLSFEAIGESKMLRGYMRGHSDNTVTVYITNGSEAVCRTPEEIARFIAGEFGLTI